MCMIFGTMEIPNVPAEPDMPPATTGDDVRSEEASNPKSKVETDEEMLGVSEEASYEGHTEADQAMVDVVVQASLEDTPLADPIGAGTVDVTPGTDAQVQLTTPGTDAPIDGATV
uniref:Polyprotein protein n=1 Tax=Solanum tuberosum TaxID=4113 RepID=M1DDU4_SOLTU